MERTSTEQTPQQVIEGVWKFPDGLGQNDSLAIKIKTAVNELCIGAQAVTLKGSDGQEYICSIIIAGVVEIYTIERSTYTGMISGMVECYVVHTKDGLEMFISKDTSKEKYPLIAKIKPLFKLEKYDFTLAAMMEDLEADGLCDIESLLEEVIGLFEELCIPSDAMQGEYEKLPSNYPERVFAMWGQLLSNVFQSYVKDSASLHHTFVDAIAVGLSATATVLRDIEVTDPRVQRFIEIIGFTPTDFLKRFDFRRRYKGIGSETE